MPLQKSRRLRAIGTSILLSLVVLFLKWWAYVETSSVAIRSDAIESIVNVVASCFALFAIIYAARPADENHPYGHGKIEFFSAVFEGALISLAAGLIIFEGAWALVEGPELRELDRGLFLVAISGVVNGALGLFLLRTGKHTRSKAIEADGWHVISDFWTSVGLIAGLIVVKYTGWVYLDPVMAIGVGILLGRMGWKVLKDSSGALLDEEDPALMKDILKEINKWPIEEIVSLHWLRAMRAGAFAHVDVHLIVPEYMDVREAHNHVHRFSDALIEATGLHGEWHTHFEPCRRRYCTVCPLKECPIRAREFVARKSLTLEEASSPYETIPDPKP